MTKQYGYEDEGSHPVGDGDPDWQESVFVNWYDAAAGICGVSRIGHEPNRADGGRSALQCFVATTDGVRFRRADHALPLEAPTTERGLRAGGSQWHVDGGAPRLVLDEPGLEADLAMDNYYPLTDFFPPSGSMVENFLKNHYECSGRIRGSVRIAGRSYDVDGHYHRDHSWGVRKHSTLKSHRWVPGTFGPGLSFGSIVWHSSDDVLVKAGYLVRDGEVIFASDVDVLTYVDMDGFSHRGGEVRLFMPDGELLELRPTLVDAVAMQLHHIFYIDSVCEVRLGDLVGMCNLETTNNAQLGTSPVGLSLNAVLESGLTGVAG